MSSSFDQLIKQIESIHLEHFKGISAPQLYRFRLFYLTYPNILSAVMIKLQHTDLLLNEIFSVLPSKAELEAFIQREINESPFKN